MWFTSGSRTYSLALSVVRRYNRRGGISMQTIRGVYDGKTIRPLPAEPLPDVDGEIPVEIVFVKEGMNEEELRRQRTAALARLRESRAATPPWNCSLREMI